MTANRLLDDESDDAPAELDEGAEEFARSESTGTRGMAPPIADAPEPQPEPTRDAPADKGVADDERQMTRTGSIAKGIPAKLTFVGNGEVVIEVTFGEAFEWKLLADAVIRLADGSMHSVKILLSRSTRPGTIGAGRTARLVLATELIPIWVISGSLFLEVEHP